MWTEQPKKRPGTIPGLDPYFDGFYGSVVHPTHASTWHRRSWGFLLR